MSLSDRLSYLIAEMDWVYAQSFLFASPKMQRYYKVRYQELALEYDIIVTKLEGKVAA